MVLGIKIYVSKKIKRELKWLLEQTLCVRVNFRFNEMIIDDITIIFLKMSEITRPINFALRA